MRITLYTSLANPSPTVAVPIPWRSPTAKEIRPTPETRLLQAVRHRLVEVEGLERTPLHSLPGAPRDFRAGADSSQPARLPQDHTAGWREASSHNNKVKRNGDG